MTAAHHDLVADFARTFGHPILDTPAAPDRKLRKLRVALLREEYRELIAAVHAHDHVEIADALADIAYIAHGTLHAYGLPFDPLAASTTNRPGLASAYYTYTQAERAAQQTIGGALDDIQRHIGKLLNLVIVETKAIAGSLGIPYDPVFREVHDSNMSKLGADGKPVVLPSGKTGKGPNTRKPNLAPLLIDAGVPVTVAA